jgi:oxygen-dependent protoporphyrinogen oxidase
LRNTEDKHIAIIGAGLTGLTTAFYLKKHGFNFQLFEQADRAGGVIRTHHENGFTFESGPNTGSMSRPEAAELFEDLADDCTLEIADKNAKARWIWMGEKWHTIPSGLIGGITTPLFKFSDKLRLCIEPFKKKGTNPNETMADLVRRRMGKSFLRNAIDPFISGVYSGDPEKLITRFAFPKLYALEQNYGSFIGGAIKKAKEPKADRDKKATKEVFSAEGGLQNLVTALVKHIGEENIKLNCKDISVSITDKEKYKVSDSSSLFSHVISTIGSYQLGNTFPFLPDQEIHHINQLQYAKVTQVTLGFKEWKGIPIQSFGGLVPSAEKRDVLGVLLLSSFLKNRAPEGGALLSIFLGGVRKPEFFDFSNDKIIEIVKREVCDMMELDEFSPELIKIFRYPYAIPQYSFESEDKLEAISNIEKQFPGLILAGNIRDGIGMADRIKQGRNIADKIANQLV